MQTSETKPRTILNGSVLFLATLVICLTGALAWNAYEQYREASKFHLASELTEDVISASVILALERGTTMAALGADEGKRAPFTSRLPELRSHAKEHWDHAVQHAEELSRMLPAGNVVGETLIEAMSAYRQVDAARSRFDTLIHENSRGIQQHEWFDVASRFIELTATLRTGAFSSVRLPSNLAQMNTLMRERIWIASEYAGKERGIIAFYISAGRTLPLAKAEKLESNRKRLEREIGVIQLFRSKIDSSPVIGEAIERMENEFIRDYSALVESVYAATRSGDYPLSSMEWLVKSTKAVDSILEVSTAITDVSNAYAKEVMERNQQQLYYVATLLLASLLVVVLNLAKVRQIFNALFQQKELAEVTLHTIGNAVITTDAKSRIQYLNPEAERLTGWTSSNAKGRPAKELFNVINPVTSSAVPNPINVCLREKRVTGFTEKSILRRHDGREVIFESSAAPIRNKEGSITGAVMVFYEHDLAGQKSHLLAYNASHDSLTGLINRREFEHRFCELLDRTRISHEQHLLCYIDLDQFKIVNDTCGHAAGDKLLQHLTHLLNAHVRETDILARLGGDEFGLLIIDATLDEGMVIAEKLLEQIRAFRFSWHGRNFTVGASIGLAPVTNLSVSVAELMSEADAACFAAKDNGRNCVQVYEPSNVELAQRHREMHWVSRITEALEQDNFVLFGQIISPVNDDQMAHTEILVRMRDKMGELISPANFLPAAERYDLMPQIDRWVVENTLAYIENHFLGHQERMVFNINISGASLNDLSLSSYIKERLLFHQIPAGLVCFEVTETAAISNLAQAREFITTLRKVGCRFALDDFGSGLSSFSYLKNLPVDYLKIDGNLIEGIDKDPVIYGMVEAIQRVAQLMQLKTIAEYVSSESILTKLQKIGVDYAQGFAIDHPRPIEEYITEQQEKTA